MLHFFTVLLHVCLNRIIRYVEEYLKVEQQSYMYMYIEVFCLKHSVYGVYFFFCSVNVKCGQAEERVLLTGLHAVADIFCECCNSTLGWKYVSFPYFPSLPQALHLPLS